MFVPPTPPFAVSEENVVLPPFPPTAVDDPDPKAPTL
jgi:hypothetical protein